MENYNNKNVSIMENVLNLKPIFLEGLKGPQKF